MAARACARTYDSWPPAPAGSLPEIRTSGRPLIRPSYQRPLSARRRRPVEPGCADGKPAELAVDLSECLDEALRREALFVEPSAVRSKLGAPRRICQQRS